MTIEQNQILERLRGEEQTRHTQELSLIDALETKFREWESQTAPPLPAPAPAVPSNGHRPSHVHRPNRGQRSGRSDLTKVARAWIDERDDAFTLLQLANAIGPKVGLSVESMKKPLDFFLRYLTEKGRVERDGSRGNWTFTPVKFNEIKSVKPTDKERAWNELRATIPTAKPEEEP